MLVRDAIVLQMIKSMERGHLWGEKEYKLWSNGEDNLEQIALC